MSGTNGANGNLVHIKPGEVLNPTGINQYTKGKSMQECLVAAGKELCQTMSGGEMQANEYAALAMRRIMLEFFTNFGKHSSAEFKQKFEVVKMWMERVAPVGSVSRFEGVGAEQKTVIVRIFKEGPLEVIDVPSSSSMCLDGPETQTNGQ